MRLGERLLVALLGLIVSACFTASPANARTEADILIDVATGSVLAARNADDPVAPASLTKMMTLYLTFRAIESGQLKLESRLEISRRAATMPPTKLGLRAGSTIEVEDAILGSGDALGQRCRNRPGRGSRRNRGSVCGGHDPQCATAGDDQNDIPQCVRPAGCRAAHHGTRPCPAGDPPDRGLSRLLSLFLPPQLLLCRAHPRQP